MALPGPGFPDRTFPGTADFPRGRESGFRETLFEREILVLDQGFVVVCREFVAEEGLDETDLVGDVVDSDRGERSRWCKSGGVR